jgi:hypothetical protein
MSTLSAHLLKLLLNMGFKNYAPITDVIGFDNNGSSSATNREFYGDQIRPPSPASAPALLISCKMTRYNTVSLGRKGYVI